ncbi:MAG TPA: hypothetical protein DCY20_02820 [Firmicutes bacterium]|nr:hypothetical protein [Bacillota bacterium]
MKKIVLSLINIASFVFFIWANFSVNASQVFIGTTEPPLIMPASYAFFIWFIIYVLIALWLLFQFKVSDQGWRVYERVSRFFAINMVLTALSLFVPQVYAPFMIGLSFLTLAFIYITIQHEFRRLKFDKNESVLKELKYFKLPFSIYFGWISVALIVDISIVLKTLGYSGLFGLSEVFFACCILVFGAFIAVAHRNINNDIPYLAVWIWAYIAIAISQMGGSLAVLVAACCGIVFMAFFLEKQPEAYR